MFEDVLCFTSKATLFCLFVLLGQLGFIVEANRSLMIRNMYTRFHVIQHYWRCAFQVKPSTSRLFEGVFARRRSLQTSKWKEGAEPVLGSQGREILGVLFGAN